MRLANVFNFSKFCFLRMFKFLFIFYSELENSTSDFQQMTDFLYKYPGGPNDSALLQCI